MQDPMSPKIEWSLDLRKENHPKTFVSLNFNSSACTEAVMPADRYHSPLLAFYYLTYVMPCCKTLSLNERRRASVLALPPSLEGRVASQCTLFRPSGMLIYLVVRLHLRRTFKPSDNADMCKRVDFN